MLSHDKWIVVTTIQYPTPQLRTLAQMPGWHLLVVGDKKTPHDWYLEGCEYLSPEKQQTLGYALAELLPWNHYSRKNIGYLYAIEHGASIIYDTDDDNEPYGDLHPLADTVHLTVVHAKHNCVNMFGYFGCPDVWPRGYPIDKITDNGAFIIESPEHCCIGIEQGMINQDPDVDAIFRLTKNKPVFFTDRVSCVLALGTYCPTNSQNTFTHKKAFFTLYLPSTVNMRITDIWRGYCAQKLLEQCHLRIVFSGPSAIQERNPHNLMHDFMQEQDLYLKSGQLVTFLYHWQRFDAQDFLKSMYTLYEDLITEKFLGTGELALCKAWIEDLIKVGYHSATILL